MINYLQLGRNLRRFAPRVPAKRTTYIFNSKGIYDFKQKKPELCEALTESFRDVENPVLELTVYERRTHPVGSIHIKDGEQEISSDSFILQADTEIEQFIPDTDGCIKKSIYDRAGIQEIGKQYKLLQKFLSELTEGLKNPTLEFFIKNKNKYTIGNVLIKDGEKQILNGYFSKSYTGTPFEKFHFLNLTELITGIGIKKDTFCKRHELLPDKLQKRLWMLQGREKEILKMRYGIDCSPKATKEIAKKLKLTDSRIRGIIQDCLEQMKKANTYCSDLKYDLDNVGHILTDEERYNIFMNGSSFDINQAETKIIMYNRKAKKLK